MREASSLFVFPLRARHRSRRARREILSPVVSMQTRHDGRPRAERLGGIGSDGPQKRIRIHYRILSRICLCQLSFGPIIEFEECNT